MLPAIQQLIKSIKDARNAKNLSQRALADQLGIPQSHLSKIEAGLVNIKLSSFVEMARMLDLEVMLVPRQSISLVKDLMSAKEKTHDEHEIRAAYTLED